ncbi:MAG: hypothetical protein KatS3mg013_1846 [Actinomycetota bacterium]|nr:MAG: hypothetical protein KatS3mg013_1846 [Actinomycetota bacterium]
MVAPRGRVRTVAAGVSLGILLAGAGPAPLVAAHPEAVAGAPLAVGAPGAFAPGRVLVTFAPGATRAARADAVARMGARLGPRLLGPVAIARISPGVDPLVAARRLERDPAVLDAEPDWIRYLHASCPGDPGCPDDPAFDEQWGLNNVGQRHLVNDPPPTRARGAVDADADVPEAWGIHTGDPATTIAVVDSGVWQTHPDLDDRLWTNPGEIPGNGLDDDANGFVDDVHGWDFIGDDPVPNDALGHGTHVAGIAAAERDNATGIAGVCPGCTIMALRVADARGALSTSAALRAIRYAADEGAAVINLSYGGPQWSRAERRAIAYAGRRGALVVVSAGNEHRDNDTLGFDAPLGFTGPSYPASYDLPAILSVGASTHDDRLGAFTGCLLRGEPNCAFSNWGRTSVDLVAPGVDVYSTAPPSGYRVENGTSMSAPFVAGVAGLVRSSNPALGPVEVKNVLMNAVDRPSALPRGLTVTDGRINAQRALGAPSTAPATPLTDGVMGGARSILRVRRDRVAVPRDVNDIYRRRLRKGRSYEVRLRVPKGRDFDLFVWKPGARDTWPTDYGCRGTISCLLVGAGIRGVGRHEVVRFRAPRTGTFYLHVSAFVGSGRYTLTIDRIG